MTKVGVDCKKAIHSYCALAHHHYLQNCLSKSGLVGTAYTLQSLFTELFIKVRVVGVEVFLVQVILNQTQSLTKTLEVH